jgi:hypothetical protein
MILPYIIRNIISSGYPFFPSAIFNILHVDWKLNATELHQLQHYITAYARFPVADYNEAEKVLEMPYSQWIPLWWKNTSLPDQLLLITTAVLLLINLIRIKTVISRLTWPYKTILAISLTGSIVWFIAAPAIRFGTGFLIPLVFCLFAGISHSFHLPALLFKNRFYKTVVLLCCVVLLAYSCYRVKNFFTFSQIVFPEGVKMEAINQ